MTSIVRVADLLRTVTISVAMVSSGWAAQTAVNAADRESQRALGQQILQATGARGGLIVHLGCGDGQLTTALHADKDCLVHGLDADPNRVDAARRHVRSLGLYGKVSVDTFDGRHLPYIDHLVNLVVADGPGVVSTDSGLTDGVPMDEVMRVLAPGGVAYIKDGASWTKAVKPWPEEIDQWTHFLHGPDNNAVAADSVVGPPRRMQWLAEPKWTRHHGPDKGTQPAIRAVVAAGGRIHYLVDETTAAHIKVPSRWSLVTRDAFNGVLLWKRPLPIREFPRRLEQLWRALVTDGDRLYVPLGTEEPLSALDSETRKQMCELLEEISRRERVTVLHVTHNLDEARHLADCLFSLVDGKIQQLETLQE